MIKWMKVGNIPDGLLQHNVFESYVAVNQNQYEIFAGIHKVRSDLLNYVLTYRTHDSNKITSLPFNTFDECIAHINSFLERGDVEAIISNERVFDKMLLEEMK